tara:strand:- start:376 stop:549 length:174 start_codon:yes stop_codon:yes gene_type:complete
MDDYKTFTNQTIIGKSMLKKEKIDYHNYFENSILNFMIVENYNRKKDKKQVHKKDIK